MAAPPSTAIPPTNSPPGLSYLSVFAQDSVKRLSSGDFSLDTPEKIRLNSSECTVILFYGENSESRALARIWSIVAQQSAGPIMAAINVMVDTKVAVAMTDIRSSGSHPLHWAAMKGYPFILSYRGNYPVAFYNGERSTQAILEWVMTLACEANYYERFDISAGVRVNEEDNLRMPATTPYPSATNPLRTQSSQFTSAAPMRGLGTMEPAAAAGTTPATPVPVVTPGPPQGQGAQVVQPQ
jgi:hypothetical protein